MKHYRMLALFGVILLSLVMFFNCSDTSPTSQDDHVLDRHGPRPSPSPRVSPSPSPSPTVSPSPSPSPSVSPSPSPTVDPSPSPSPTVSPSPSPSPTVSPSPSPSPTVDPSPSPSPEIHLRGAIQVLVVRGANDGDVTVKGVIFEVTTSTRLEDDDGNDITLDSFSVGETVDAWGPPAQNNTAQATRIRKR